MQRAALKWTISTQYRRTRTECPSEGYWQKLRVNYAAFRKSLLIIPLRPRCNVESSLQNAHLVDTAARDLENQLTRMGFITMQHFYVAQGRRETRHICDTADKVGLFTPDTERRNAEWTNQCAQNLLMHLRHNMSITRPGVPTTIWGIAFCSVSIVMRMLVPPIQTWQLQFK